MSKSQALNRLTVLTALMLTMNGPAVQAQKPVKTQPIEVLHTTPPATPTAMAAEADAVVIGRYVGLGKSAVRQAGAPERPIPITPYSFQVVEVLKSNHPKAPLTQSAIDVPMYGGDKEYPDHIRRSVVPGVRAFVSGHTYVLFLKWNELTDAVMLPWGPASIYDVTNGKVTGLADFSRSHDGESASAFVGSVRRQQ